MGRPGGDVLFEYQPGRCQEFARKLLGSFRDLQRDGYGGYGALAKANPGLIAVDCWAPARRKWIEAPEHTPAEAALIVQELRKLYGIERHARDGDLNAAQRHAVGQELFRPILTALRPELEAQREASLPQSPLGKAARHALAEWEALPRHLNDGRLEIDNNLTANAIRPSSV